MALVVALLVAHVLLGLVPALGRVTTDFANYYVPARARWTGHGVGRLYERETFDREAREAGLDGLGSFVPHPPPNALLLLPVAALSVPAAKTIWTLLLAGAYAAAFVVLRRALPSERLDALSLALIALLPSAALVNAFSYGQPYPLLLLILSLSLLAAVRGRWMLAGFLLAPVLALKLYGLPFAAAFALSRRWRALAGLVAGTAFVVLLSVAVLGREVHVAYAREVLPASLEGRIQDPYSTVWQSASSLAWRLSVREPDLNPEPALDRPDLARPAVRGATLFVVALTVLAAAAARTPGRQWAIVACGALAASPLGATYHFLLLALPVAVWMSEAERGRAAMLAVLSLYAFSTSSLPHYFGRWAHGLTAPLAYPRLWAALALLVLLAAPFLSRRRVAIAALVGLLAAATAPVPPRDAGWERLAAGGYLVAEPIECGGAQAWLGIEGARYVVRGSDGTRRPVIAAPQVPVCRDGGIEAAAPPSDIEAWTARFGAPARHVRPSPDGARVVAQVWRAGSWNLETWSNADGRVVPLTRDAANEVEPSWSDDGRSVLFASDRDRGLGSTAAYRLRVRE